MKRLFLIWFILLAFVGLAAESVSLQWDANKEPDVGGYKVYYGTNSRVYFASVDVGNTTTTTIGNLTPGVTYYFMVTAYDASKLESAPSNEVSGRVPFLPTGTNGLPSKVKGFVPSR
jgi:fibronectin type 3 domain-containing protein